MNSNRVVTAIIGKEVGESGNSHLQGYICFTDRVRQSTIHSILGYTTPCMHLSVQGKSGPSQGKPPLAAFWYCMKEDDYYVIGKDLDAAARTKDQLKAAGVPPSEVYADAHRDIENRLITSMTAFREFENRKYAKLAAKDGEYFKGLIVDSMSSLDVEDHPLRPWQQSLYDQLTEKPSDREVIFVVDKNGGTGKTHFIDWYCNKNPAAFHVGADKRDDISYLLMNEVVERGPPQVVFMDAPRSRNAYISSSFLEELKNAKIVSPKYKSKRLRLPHHPHAVVMTNAFPKKSGQDQGLSNDRYTYLHIQGDKFVWLRGYRVDPNPDEGGAMTPGFHPPVTSTINGRVYVDNGTFSDGRNKTITATAIDTVKQLIQDGIAKEKK